MADATIVITTYNRCEEVGYAIESALTQDADVEVLVMDDASEDDTAELIPLRYPDVRFVCSEQNIGLVEQRNLASKHATAPVIFSLDDDAHFCAKNTVSRALALFDDARIAVVALPYRNAGEDFVRQQGPADRTLVTSHFAGGAHAIRKDAFDAVGGYRGMFYRQGEERDLALRLVAAGYVVRLGDTEPIFHNPSPVRDRSAMAFYGRRNEILFGAALVPVLGYPSLLRMIGKGCVLSAQDGHGRDAVRGVREGFKAAVQHREHRKPVSRAAYRRYRWLKEPRDIKSLPSELLP